METLAFCCFQITSWLHPYTETDMVEIDSQDPIEFHPLPSGENPELKHWSVQLRLFTLGKISQYGSELIAFRSIAGVSPALARRVVQAACTSFGDLFLVARDREGLTRSLPNAPWRRFAIHVYREFAEDPFLHLPVAARTLEAAQAEAISYAVGEYGREFYRAEAEEI